MLPRELSSARSPQSCWAQSPPDPLCWAVLDHPAFGSLLFSSSGRPDSIAFPSCRVGTCSLPCAIRPACQNWIHAIDFHTDFSLLTTTPTPSTYPHPTTTWFFFVSKFMYNSPRHTYTFSHALCKSELSGHNRNSHQYCEDRGSLFQTGCPSSQC